MQSTVLDKTKKITDKIMLILLIFSASIIPLLVRTQVIALNEQTMIAAGLGSTYVDVFSYWKAYALKAVLILLLFLWMLNILQRNKYKLKSIFLPLGMYSILVIISTITSDYKWISINGLPDRLEGVYVLLAYSILAFTAGTVLKTNNDRILIIVATFISSILMLVLGLFELAGHDLMLNDAGIKFITPDKYMSYIHNVFVEVTGLMYTTVYNSNYLGSYAALLLPISITLVLYWGNKKLIVKMVTITFTVITFTLWLGSFSRAGIVGGGIALIILLVLLRKQIFKQWIITVVTLSLCLVMVVVLNIVSSGKVTAEFKSMLPSKTVSSAKVITSTTKSAISLPIKPLVTDVFVNENTFAFATTTETIIMQYQNGGLIARDIDGNALKTHADTTYKESGLRLSFNDDRYIAYKLDILNDGFILNWYGTSIPVSVKEGKMTIGIKSNIFISSVSKPMTFGFKGNELFANSRGYIWSRSIPLMLDTIIIGHGPDTFAAYFPQKELDAKLNYLRRIQLSVNKPHNWYLQLAINTGVLSLLFILIFIGWFIISSIKKWKTYPLEDHTLHIGIACGVLAYCIAAIFNDSIVSVAPVFWVMLGIGISYINNKQEE